MSSLRLRSGKQTYFNSPDVSLYNKELGLRLIDSVLTNDLLTIKVLLEQTQVDVNYKDWLKLTPLHYAKSIEAVDILMRYGADVNSTEPGKADYWCPLHSATKEKKCSSYVLSYISWS